MRAVHEHRLDAQRVFLGMDWTFWWLPSCKLLGVMWHICLAPPDPWVCHLLNLHVEVCRLRTTRDESLWRRAATKNPGALRRCLKSWHPCMGSVLWRRWPTESLELLTQNGPGARDVLSSCKTSMNGLSEIPAQVDIYNRLYRESFAGMV